jgi:hypothetical protein
MELINTISSNINCIAVQIINAHFNGWWGREVPDMVDIYINKVERIRIIDNGDKWKIKLINDGLLEKYGLKTIQTICNKNKTPVQILHAIQSKLLTKLEVIK